MVFRATGARLACAVFTLAGVLLASCAPKPDPEAAKAAAAAAAKAAAEAADNAHPGKAVFETYCASCHDNPQRSGAPQRDAIRSLNRMTVRYALTKGFMKQQAINIPPDDIAKLIDWVPRDGEGDTSWQQKAQCPTDRRAVKLDGAPRISTNFGVNAANTRSLTAEQAGLTKADMGNLELAWSVAFPNTLSMRSQPLVVGDTIFAASVDTASIFALDAGTGCLKWSFTSDATMRSSLAFAEPTAAHPAMVLAGDSYGRVVAVNAETGAQAWVTDVKLHFSNRITGGPVVEGDTVYTPVSSIEVSYTDDDDYQCCQSQGLVVALDVATGKQKWVGRTMVDAKPTQKSRTGTQQWGPSGAIIWSSPAADAKRGLVYAGTGENTSWPATDTSDAIIAYDMKTGARRWVFQATKVDIWNHSCGRRAPNCTWPGKPGEYWSPDYDFGASAMLIHRPDGQELVVAGQKSGVLWAINPDNGKLVWSNKIGRGSALGGVHWGTAYDAKADRIFAPLNDPAFFGRAPAPNAPPVNPGWGPGVHAVDAKTGEVKWTYQPTAKDCGRDVPAGVVTEPAKEWRLVPVKAPLTPPPPRPSPTARPSAAASPAATPTASASAPPAPASPATPAAAASPRPAPCRLGMSAPPLVVDGAVVTGSLSGMLRIHNGETGKVLFEYQTNKDFPNTANGVPGHGGSLDSAPYVAGNGMLFVQSGYVRFGQDTGNVLLAFKPKAAK